MSGAPSAWSTPLVSQLEAPHHPTSCEVWKPSRGFYMQEPAAVPAWQPAGRRDELYVALPERGGERDSAAGMDAHSNVQAVGHQPAGPVAVHPKGCGAGTPWAQMRQYVWLIYRVSDMSASPGSYCPAMH